MSEYDEKQATKPVTASLELTHPLEKWLSRDWVRWLLGMLSKDRPGSSQPHLDRALTSYGDRKGLLHERVIYRPIHAIIDRLRGEMSRQQLREKLGGHRPTVRGIVATARSIAQLGLTVPQRWLNPLFVVWNFTNRCNLHCRHCYQSSIDKTDGRELSLEEKLSLIDQFGNNYVAMITFTGGEPMLSGDLYPALNRCNKYGIHTTLATHGGLLSKERCRRLAELGLRYVEVSLDSIDPEKHDQFRGRAGTWRQSVEGVKNVVATDGLRAGLAMCVTRENIHEVEKMLKFAVELGVSCFTHFNFIPVGRGKEMADHDITPVQREELLCLLHEWMQSRQIGVISTAPQFGRVCLAHAGEEGLVSCFHVGNGSGIEAQMVARYLGGCGAGRTYACLQSNGDVTPCAYMPDRTMGNVRQNSFTEIFRGSQWWDLLYNRHEREGNCGICEYRYYCGGCRARADAYFDRLDQSDPGCINNLALWQQLTGPTTTETVQIDNRQYLYKHLKTSDA